jgi:hypothetical protein
MNKLAYQPLPVLLRAEPNDARSTSNSARFLRVIAALGTVFTLCGVVAIFLIGFREVPKKEAKGPVEAPLPTATILSPAAAPSLDQPVGARLPDTNQVLRETIAEDRSIVDQPLPLPPANPTSIPANPTSIPTQVSQPETPVSEGDSVKRERPEDARTTSDRYLSETARKNLERHRRKAEHERSRLETLYGKHAISWETYKKGEQKYKSQIEQYRTKMNASIEPNNQEASGLR